MTEPNVNGSFNGGPRTNGAPAGHADHDVPDWAREMVYAQHGDLQLDAETRGINVVLNRARLARWLAAFADDADVRDFILLDVLAAALGFGLSSTGLPESAPSLSSRPFRLWEYVWLFKVLGLGSGGKRVLDLGGTDTHLTFMTALAGNEVETIDINPAFVLAGAAAARSLSLARYSAQVADMTDLGRYDDESFDVVMSASVIEHLTADDQKRAIREAARVLKPGGILGLTFDYGEPAPGANIYLPAPHMPPRSSVELLDMMRQGDLAVLGDAVFEEPVPDSLFASRAVHYTIGSIFAGRPPLTSVQTPTPRHGPSATLQNLHVESIVPLAFRTALEKRSSDPAHLAEDVDAKLAAMLSELETRSNLERQAAADANARVAALVEQRDATERELANALAEQREAAERELANAHAEREASERELVRTLTEQRETAERELAKASAERETAELELARTLTEQREAAELELTRTLTEQHQAAERELVRAHTEQREAAERDLARAFAAQREVAEREIVRAVNAYEAASAEAEALREPLLVARAELLERDREVATIRVELGRALVESLNAHEESRGEFTSLQELFQAERRELARRDDDLATARGLLEVAERELRSRDEALLSARGLLETAERDLHASDGDLEATRGRLDVAGADLANTQQELATAHASLASAERELTSKRQDLQRVESSAAAELVRRLNEEEQQRAELALLRDQLAAGERDLADRQAAFAAATERHQAEVEAADRRRIESERALAEQAEVLEGVRAAGARDLVIALNALEESRGQAGVLLAGTARYVRELGEATKAARASDAKAQALARTAEQRAQDRDAARLAAAEARHRNVALAAELRSTHAQHERGIRELSSQVAALSEQLEAANASQSRADAAAVRLRRNLSATSEAFHDVVDIMTRQHEYLRYYQAEGARAQASVIDELRAALDLSQRRLQAIHDETPVGLMLRKALNRMPSAEALPVFSRRRITRSVKNFIKGIIRRGADLYVALSVPKLALPKITIVTPVFNGAEYIDDAIRSVTSQDYPDLEYLVLDGGSTDDTVAIARRHTGITVLSMPDNGMYDALRRGFGMSSGEVFGYLNADDLLEPGALRRVGEYFARNKKTQVIYHEDIVDVEGWRFPNIAQPAGVDLERIFSGHVLFQDGVFFRRDAYLRAGGFNPTLKLAGDADFWARLARRFRFERLPGHVSTFRVRAGQLSNNMQQYNAERSAALSAFRKSLPIGERVRLRLRSAIRRLAGAQPERNDDRLFFPIDFAQMPPPKGVVPAFPTHDIPCPFTGARPDRLLFSSRDTRFGNELINYIYYVPETHLTTTYPALDDAALAQLYESHYSDEHPSMLIPSGTSPYRGYAPKGLLARLAATKNVPPLLAKRAAVNWVDQTFEEMTAVLRRTELDLDQPLAFLDVGCFDGKLLDRVRQGTPWRILGVEPNKNAAEIARSKGHDVIDTSVEQLVSRVPLQSTFDIIWLGQAIEHFNDPLAAVFGLRTLLKPGALLVLSTPNLDSAQIDMFGPTWAQWHPPYHRYIFSKKSLEAMAERTRMTLLDARTFSHPYWSALNVWQNAHGLGAVLPHGIELPSEIVERATNVAAWSKLLFDWRGRGDYIVAAFRKEL